MIVVVCTDLLGKETRRKVSMDRVVTSGSICGVMVITLVLNRRDVGSILARHNISHFHHPHDSYFLLLESLIKQIAIGLTHFTAHCPLLVMENARLCSSEYRFLSYWFDTDESTASNLMTTKTES